IKKSLETLADEEVIRKMGEPGFAVKLALEKGVSVVSPELPLRQELELFSSNGVSKDLIFAFYFFRALNGYTRQSDDKTQVQEKLQRSMLSFKDFTQWQGFDFSFEHAEKLALELWGTPIDFTPEFYNERVSPWSKET